MTLPTKCSVTVLKSVGAGEIPVPKGQGEETKLQVTKADGTKAEVVVKTRPLPSKPAAGQEKANNLIQALLSEVLEKQPAEPYAFMLQRLKDSKGDLTTVDGNVGSFVKDELMKQM